MIQQVRVRDLNSLANQLANGSFLQEKLQKLVLDSISLGHDTLDFDDEKIENKQLLQMVADAINKEKSINESRSIIRREPKDEQNSEKEKTSRFGKSRKR